MRGLKARIMVVVLAIAILINTSTVFAEDSEDEGFWTSVGGWFVDRGTDISNATTIAIDITGQWFVDRGEDICEVSETVGKWTSDRANDITLFVTDTGEAIVWVASTFDASKLVTKEYYLDSGEKLLLGEYSDKDPTALSLVLNLAASIVNVDLGMDIRDLVYDVHNFGSEDVKLSGIALDAVAVLPVIGVVKYIKYADTAIDVVDNLHDATKAADVIDDVADTAKVVDDVKDCAKAVDLADDVIDAEKEFEKISLEELPEMVQETYKIYSDCAWDGRKAMERMTEGTRAGDFFKNADEDLPLLDELGNKLSYIEYDAYPKGFDPNAVNNNRGTHRFVRDNLGNTYYTDNHYISFKRITEAIVG